MPEKVAANGVCLAARTLTGMTDKDHIEAVLCGHPYAGTIKDAFDTWGYGGFEPGLVPASERERIVQQHAGIKAINRVPGKLREREVMAYRSCVLRSHNVLAPCIGGRKILARAQTATLPVSVS